MKKVSGPQVVTSAEASELPLPAEIQDALGELVGAARDGVDTRHYGETISAGLIGLIQLWTAGLINDRAFRSRARALVNIVFGGARDGG
jgi:hypothetical protein